MDKTVRLWDADALVRTDAQAKAALKWMLEGHTDRVKSVAFLPDSTLLASASRDTTVRLWGAATGML